LKKFPLLSHGLSFSFSCQYQRNSGEWGNRIDLLDRQLTHFVGLTELVNSNRKNFAVYLFQPFIFTLKHTITTAAIEAETIRTTTTNKV
jgi:hypothetical protein